MANWSKLLVVSALLAGTPVLGQTTEQRMQFLSGLRDRGYHDYAMLYLSLEQGRDDLPDDFRAVIPYEKAVTLMESVKSLKNPIQQSEQLEQALGFLEEFVKANPNHALAGEANSERARIKLNQARVNIWQSQSPSNQDSKGDFQVKARKLIADARVIFKTARDQHEQNWKAFPPFIDKNEDKEQFEARAAAERSFMRAQYDLALCTYEEAQTYDRDSSDYKRLLTQASTEFEAIHSKYRSQVVGLYSRMWQGKCFEEQDDLVKALGIYNELLAHPGTSDTMKRIQDQVRQFELICLNHEQRKDYQLVIQKATEWLTQNKLRGARTEIGLGIRWQLALAQEAMGKDEKLTASERERYLRESLSNIRLIEKYPGQYKDQAVFMGRRLLAQLRGEDAGDPEDFDTACGLTRNMVSQVQQLLEKLKAAKNPAERKQAQTDLELLCEETARLLNLAISLSSPSDDPDDVNLLRLQLSYMYYHLRKNYESAILGEYVGRMYKRDDENSQLSQDAAYLSMASFIRAYNESPESEKEVDMRQIERMCNLITSTWPESDRAIDARIQMGDVFRQMDKPVEAAKWYSQVPEQASQYARVQANAGQAYFNAYYNAIVRPEGERPPVEELKKWQAESEKYLRSGIDKLQKETPAAGKSPDILIAAKASLVQIVLSQGKYQDGISLLKDEPHSIIKAIQVDDPAKRPKEGIQSAEFAGLAYQSLLRAHIGLKQLREARVTMRELEKVAGGGEAVTQIYVQLGRELEKELNTLKALGDNQRYDEVRASFENFLGDMFERDDQNYNSLVWVAETYYGLGGSSDNSSDAATCFERAGATYQKILEKAQTDSQFVDSARLSGVRLRLMNCKRREGDFEGALALAADVLSANAKALDAQFESAYVYQAWGESGAADAVTHLTKAIQGDTIGAQKAPLWGWAMIGQRLQGAMRAGGASVRSQYLDKFLESQFNAATCMQLMAKQRTGPDDQKKDLGLALQRIQALAAITPDMSDTWWEKFKSLYASTGSELAALGETVPPLERRVNAKPEPAVVQKKQKLTADAKKDGEEPKNVAEKTDGGGGSGGLLGLLVAVIGGGAVVYFMVASSKKPKRRRRYDAPLAQSSTSRQKKSASPARSAGAGPARKAKPPTASSGTKQRPKSAGVKNAAAARPKQVKKKKPPQ